MREKIVATHQVVQVFRLLISSVKLTSFELQTLIPAE